MYFENCKRNVRQIVELDLSSVVPSLSGPKRPQDRVAVSDVKKEFAQCLVNPVSFKGFGLLGEQARKKTTISFKVSVNCI